jgi:hypothetical protein
MALAVGGHLWVEERGASDYWVDHLVRSADAEAILGQPKALGLRVPTLCGLELQPDNFKAVATNARQTQTGGGFDVGQPVQCGPATCKACMDVVFQMTPIPNGSEKKVPNAPSRPPTR